MSNSGPLRRHLCFLDVGHGNSTVLLAGDDEVVVIDVGRQSTLSEFLLQQEVTHIRSIYLSHADSDHIGALVGILATDQVVVDRVLLNTDSAKNTQVWDDMVYELNALHRSGLLRFDVGLVSGHTESLPGCVRLEILGPSPYLAAKGPGSSYQATKRIHSNSISAVIAVAVGDDRLALLPGDLDDVGLEDLRENCHDLHARILNYPHHGALPGSKDPGDHARHLLEAVDPELVVFSIGRGLYSTPNPETIGRLRAVKPYARIVCTQLSAHCAKRLPSVPPTHLSQAFARGRAHGACCGGTIVVPLDSLTRIEPPPALHADFIHSHAESALCRPIHRHGTL